MTDVYNRGKQRANVEAHPVGMTAMLLKSPFAYDVDDNVVADIVANEISGAGYARVVLGGVTVTEDDTADLSEFAANRASFGSIVAGETVTDCVIFVTTGTHLFCRVALSDTATNGQSFSVDFGGTNPGPFAQLQDV